MKTSLHLCSGQHVRLLARVRLSGGSEPANDWSPAEVHREEGDAKTDLFVGKEGR